VASPGNEGLNGRMESDSMAKEKPVGCCDICGEVVSEFVDGRMQNGQWANMCLTCWNRHCFAPMLGIGYGQRYLWMLCPYREKWGYYQMKGGSQPGTEKRLRKPVVMK